MLKTGLKKEMMFLGRTGKLAGIIIAMLVFAFLDGLMLKATGAMMSSMSTTMQQQVDSIAENSENSEEINEIKDITNSMSTMTSMFDSMNAPTILYSTIADISGLGMLITLLVIKSACGGEQKKRSIIIPRCAGLTPKMYILPKFILYPLMVFVLSVIAVFIAGGMSQLLFEGSILFENMLIAGVTLGVYLAFVMTVMITLGISTEKPGISVIIVLVAINIIPSLLSAYRVDRFNPFALPTLVSEAVMSENGAFASMDMLNFWVSVGTTLVISVVLYFVTLLALNSREVRNEGNEPVL